jgi:hypothetical protein
MTDIKSINTAYFGSRERKPREIPTPSVTVAMTVSDLSVVEEEKNSVFKRSEK